MRIDFLNFVKNKMLGYLDDVQVANLSNGDILTRSASGWENTNKGFLSTMAHDFVPSSDTWSIPEQRQLHVAHKLTLEGTLDIEGVVRID